MGTIRVDPGAVGRAIVAAGRDSVICLDARGSILEWNSAAEKMFGWSAADAIGKPVGLIVPDGRAQEDEVLRARALAGETLTIDTFRQGKNRPSFAVAMTLAPLQSDGAG